jgi:hypothetical protein
VIKRRGEISFCHNIWLEEKRGMERRRESERGDELSGLLDERFGERGGKLVNKGKDRHERVIVRHAFEVDCSSFDHLARK